jgi:hypothetical protein
VIGNQGLVLFVSFQLFESVFCMLGALVGFVKSVFKEVDGGGEVFGIVDEHFTVGWSCSFQNHCCCAGRESVSGGWGDQLWDLIVIVLIVDLGGVMMGEQGSSVLDLLVVVSHCQCLQLMRPAMLAMSSIWMRRLAISI